MYTAAIGPRAERHNFENTGAPAEPLEEPRERGSPIVLFITVSSTYFKEVSLNGIAQGHKYHTRPYVNHHPSIWKASTVLFTCGMRPYLRILDALSPLLSRHLIATCRKRYLVSHPPPLALSKFTGSSLFPPGLRWITIYYADLYSYLYI